VTSKATETEPGALPPALLLVAVFLIAICGLVYELVAGTLASYLLGDSITQFSIVIGVFLSAMGVGSWASRFLKNNLVAWFVGVEVAVGLVGGLTPLLGFAAFAHTEAFLPVTGSAVVIVGALVGIEIPLVIRILEEVRGLRVTVANVMGVDYLGALAASLLFPFLLLPQLGVVRAGLVMGLLNLAVAAILWRHLAAHTGAWRRPLLAALLLGALALTGGLLAAPRLVAGFESRIYQDEIIFAETSRYQRIVITRWRADWRLYLNGHLQFSSIDEYRYHESLVHPPLLAAERPRRVLILGGGDGLAVREVLRHAEIERVLVVDLDPQVTELFRDHPALSELNGGSLRDPRVEIHNADAFNYLRDTEESFDVIIADLPDPSDAMIAKLYSRSFYALAAKRLAPGGAMAVQATSPYRARKAFWCIAHTLDATPAAGSPEEDHITTLAVRPYHIVVPSFGTWGFVLAARAEPGRKLPLRIGELGLRFLNPEVFAASTYFPADMGEEETELNQLDNPVLARYYEDGYHRYLQ
jgi:spermidine synthase